jgi:hypothetical protein
MWLVYQFLEAAMPADNEMSKKSGLSVPVPENGDAATRLHAECENLRRRVAELEAECARDQRRLAELESERENYKKEACAWARKEFERMGLPSEAELRRAFEEKEGLPLEAFLSELERVARGS